MNVDGPTAILDLGGSNATIGALTLAGGTLQNGTLNASSYALQNGTVAAILSGGGAVSKSTSGTVFLSAVNSYTGGTTISQGLLQLGNNDALGGGGLSFSGGTLAYDAGSQIALGGALTLGGTDYIAPTARWPAARYTLFTASSVPSNPSNYLAVSGAPISPRQTYPFAANGSTAVTLTVSGSVGNLYWRGGGSGIWDTGTSASWFNQATGSADVCYNGDSVTFDDSAGTANAVLSRSAAARAGRSSPAASQSTTRRSATRSAARPSPHAPAC